MRRTLLLCLGIIAVTWLEFELFPGHTYLQSETQIYLPVLERLDSTGLLSRDLVATHPNVTYTIYDEVTLFLHEAVGLDFKAALTTQQLLCRAAAFLGVFLLALAAGLSDTLAFLIATLLNLGAALPGPAVFLVDYEPIPRAFALGLILLAAGLLAREKPLLAGLSGGVALLYHPPTAALFWGTVLLLFICDRQLRILLRPLLTALFVFALLLANLAQLQPGVVEPRGIFSRLSEEVANLQRYRTKYVWVSLWAQNEMWHYLAICICALWATARIWRLLNRQMRWLFVVLPVGGILSVPLSDLLLEHLRWSVISHAQPAASLVFTVAIASVACGIAGVRAALAERTWESFLWFVVVFALPVNVRILDLFRFLHPGDAVKLAICLMLAFGLAVLVRQFGAGRWRGVVLAVPVVAMFAIPGIAKVENYRTIDKKPVLALADWAEDNTWGSSIFLFPDAGKDLYPGIFRAESRRALWVDWESGEEVKFFESAATEWWARWRDTMEGGFSPQRLERLLPLPIDYYVLKRKNQLADIKPVFANRDFVVYEARDLRNASSPLHRARGT